MGESCWNFLSMGNEIKISQHKELVEIVRNDDGSVCNETIATRCNLIRQKCCVIGFFQGRIGSES